MVIGLDVDGVLADFNTAFINRVVEVTGRDLFPPRPFDIPTWNYPEHFGYTKAETSKVWEEIKKDPEFWSTLPSYDETRSVLDALWVRRVLGDDVYFITNRMGVQAKKQTERWFRGMHRFENATVLLSAAKGTMAIGLQLDAYIDDRWENALDVSVTTTRTFLLNRPWNTEYGNRPNVNRVSSVTDFLNQI